MINDTVVSDTPALSATSFIVTFLRVNAGFSLRAVRLPSAFPDSLDSRLYVRLRGEKKQKKSLDKY